MQNKILVKSLILETLRKNINAVGDITTFLNENVDLIADALMRSYHGNIPVTDKLREKVEAFYDGLSSLIRVDVLSGMDGVDKEMNSFKNGYVDKILCESTPMKTYAWTLQFIELSQGAVRQVFKTPNYPSSTERLLILQKYVGADHFKLGKEAFDYFSNIFITPDDKYDAIRVIYPHLAELACASQKSLTKEDVRNMLPEAVENFLATSKYSDVAKNEVLDNAVTNGNIVHALLSTMEAILLGDAIHDFDDVDLASFWELMKEFNLTPEIVEETVKAKERLSHDFDDSRRRRSESDLFEDRHQQEFRQAMRQSRDPIGLADTVSILTSMENRAASSLNSRDNIVFTVFADHYVVLGKFNGQYTLIRVKHGEAGSELDDLLSHDEDRAWNVLLKCHPEIQSIVDRKSAAVVGQISSCDAGSPLLSFDIDYADRIVEIYIFDDGVEFCNVEFNDLTILSEDLIAFECQAAVDQFLLSRLTRARHRNNVSYSSSDYILHQLHRRHGLNDRNMW